jgi:hypothetical protein
VFSISTWASMSRPLRPSSASAAAILALGHSSSFATQMASRRSGIGSSLSAQSFSIRRWMPPGISPRPARQLEHLIEMSRRENVRLQILPFVPSETPNHDEAFVPQRNFKI